MPRLLFLPLLAVAVLFGGCRARNVRLPQYATIADATREQFVNLTRLGQTGTPKSVQLRITGKIESAAKLVLLLNGHPRQTLELPAGAVDLEWTGEWASNQVSLHYLPGPGKTGALQVAYQFTD
ncbi:MAG TPA: hypothetical protein VG838_11820 [Opitutaceae bacterium]|nr:hypothetical protein [Opitutaceae bacterium]